jgi:putative superfamily III holin-X
VTASQSTGPGPRPGVAPGTTPHTTSRTAPGGTPGGTGATAEPSIGELVSTVLTESSNLVQNEIALAKLELRATVKNVGTGAGMFAAAAVVLIFSLTFGFFALAEGINALGLARWLSFLIVFGAQLLVVGALVFLGIKKIKKAKGPEQTIRTTKETVDYLKKSRAS